MTFESFSHKICSCTRLQYDNIEKAKSGNLLELFYGNLRGSFNKTTNCKKDSSQKFEKKKVVPKYNILNQKWP